MVGVAVLPVVVTTMVAADLDEARARRIQASRGKPKRHASATSNRVMTLDVRHATTQETSRAVTSTTSNRPATPLRAFLHQASRQATATTSAADAPAEEVAAALVAVITRVTRVAGFVGQAVRVRLPADKALPGGSLCGPPRIFGSFCPPAHSGRAQEAIN